jgi:enoyl-CoA hydratase
MGSSPAFARRWSHPGRRPRPAVTVELVDGVAVMTFDDGKLNAISQQMIQLFCDATPSTSWRPATHGRWSSRVARGSSARASTSTRSWWAAADATGSCSTAGTCWGRILTLPLPVVAVCTGNAIAAGAALLLVTDVRLGADGAFKIGFNEAAIGLPIPSTGLLLAQDRLHEAVMEEALQGARLYPPQDAVDAGFLHRVVAPAELFDLAISEARGLAEGAESFRRGKQARVGPLADGLRRQLSEDIGLLRSFRV